jgi:hypothetical protein
MMKRKASAATIPILLFFIIFSISCVSLKDYRLMSWDDYVRQPSNHPYVLEIQHKNGNLLYYGAFHKVDPTHPQFEDIEEKWEKFQPTIAFCEGNMWPLEETCDEAIEKYGEQGFVTFLAARDGIQIECIDPSQTDQIKYLKYYFPHHLIKAYFIMRQAAINRMLERDTGASEYANRFFRKINHIYGQNNSPSNLKDFEVMVANLFPDLDDWRNIPYSYFQRPKAGGFLTAIHRKLNNYRDRIMIKKVAKALKQGKRVFAIVGRSHVVIQEAALRSLL